MMNNLMSDVFSRNMVNVTEVIKDFTKKVSREEFNRRVLENFPAINKNELNILYKRYLEGKYTLE